MRWRWPWRRYVMNGEAKQAISEAQDQARAAHEMSSQADQTARSAKELTRRTERFAREVERSWHVRRGPT